MRKDRPAPFKYIELMSSSWIEAHTIIVPSEIEVIDSEWYGNSETVIVKVHLVGNIKVWLHISRKVACDLLFPAPIA